MRDDVIVVSGPPGSGSTSVSRKLAERLGYRYFVPGKIHKGLVKSENETDSTLKAWDTDKGSSEEFHKKLDKMQIDEAERGKVVICGKLAIHFLKDISDKKIWLDVPLIVRAKRTAERDKMSKEEALKKIKKRQELERNEWKRIYGFDYFYQKDIADFVIDSSRLSLKETVDEILELIKS